MYAFSDNGPYSLKILNNDLQCNKSNKRINVNIDRSNLKLKLLHELRMEVLNKRLEQIMYHNRNQGKKISFYKTEDQTRSLL